MRITWQLLTVVVLAVIVGAGLALQRQATGELRGEIELLREQHREVGWLREERTRLVRAQVPAAELENLRADHEAVIRLRGEVEALKIQVGEMERGARP